MRCLLGFFGLTRSLRHTAESIRLRVYDPLRGAGIPVLSAGHFNLPATITNARSGESGVLPDRDEAALLPLDLCWIERQDDREIAAEREIACAFPDRFGDDYASTVNLCHQLRSLEQLWRLLTMLGPEPDDLFIFLRPDLLYLDPLDPVRDLAPLRDGAADLIVPGWQNWGGLNDRFAFATARGALAYATRRSRFEEGCLAMEGMHAESFLQLVARQERLRVAHTGLRAVRLRANGAIAGNDLGMLQVMNLFERLGVRDAADLTQAQLAEAVPQAFPAAPARSA